MHPLQNGSQATTRPAVKPLVGIAGWFTESGDNNIPSYPGADWFNHVIAEFQNALAEMGVTFDPTKDDHLKIIFAYFKEYLEQIGVTVSDNEQVLKTLFSASIVPSKFNAVALSFFNSKKSTSILGDSIAAGAFAGNLFSNGWTRLLARALNAEYGSASYGFTPFLTLGTGPNLSIDVHNVSISAGWVNFDSNNAEPVVTGQFFRSQSSGNTISFNLPTFMPRCKLHFVQKPTGGTFDVSINGVVTNTVDTNGILDEFSSVELTLTDNGLGSCTVLITTTSTNDVDFFGISYLSSLLETVCHNFSVSGRRLRYVGDNVLQTICENSHTLIMALGHNDYGETDLAYQNTVSAKIDFLIEQVNANKVLVVVPDFCWSAGNDNWMRLLLKKLASQTNGIYVDLPSTLLKNDGTPADFNHLVNILGMWVDGSHPNKLGNQLVFEMIAKAMKLSCTSKIQVLSNHDYPVPLQLSPTVSIKNSLTTTLSSVVRSGNALLLNFYITKNPTGPIPVGQYVLSAAWPDKFDFSGIQGAVAPVMQIDGSVIIGGVVISASGEIVLNVTSLSAYNDLYFQVAVTRSK
ncbi:SGNH/GDSL hydrolase family protein [Shewanella bicestrii]